VTLEEATAKSTQLNVMFMETSAKAGHNVKSLFKKIAMSLPGMEKDGQADGQNTSMSLFYIYHLVHPPYLCHDGRNRRHDTSNHRSTGSIELQLLIDENPHAAVIPCAYTCCGTVQSYVTLLW
jgi:hypothetical protein